MSIQRPMPHAFILTLSCLQLIGVQVSAAATAQKTTDQTAQFQVPNDFVVERIYEVPKEFGSWVGLTKLANGDLAACDQYGGI